MALSEAARGPSDPALVKPLQIQGRLFYIQGRYEAALVNIARARALLADRTDTATVAELVFEEGRALGLSRIFALTYRPGFFERLGWEQADVMNLPRKVWNECYRCPKFPGCDEIAMVLDLDPAEAPTAVAGASA